MSDLQEPQKETVEPPSIGVVAVSILVGYVIIALAGYGTAISVDQFGHYGLLLLWAVGIAGGRAALLVLKDGRSPLVGAALAIGCYAAGVFVFLFFFRFNMVAGEKGWLESARLLPTFWKQNPISAIIGLIGATAGATAAFNAAAKRYRYVRVEA